MAMTAQPPDSSPSSNQPRSTAAWFYRVLELDDGGWECRRGRTTIDTHETCAAALAHIAAVASANRPSQVFVHRIGEIAVVAQSFD